MTENSESIKMTFEEANAELESIVSRMEKGDVPLEESVAIFERGELLKKHCDTLLRSAEAKVEKIKLNGKQNSINNWMRKNHFMKR